MSKNKKTDKANIGNTMGLQNLYTIHKVNGTVTLVNGLAVSST